MLQSATTFIPVPLIQDAVGVALEIIEVCEERCEVCNLKISPRKGCKMVYKNIIARIHPSSVKRSELKDRVYNLSMVIAETFTLNNESGSDEATIIKAAESFAEDIKELVR